MASPGKRRREKERKRESQQAPPAAAAEPLLLGSDFLTLSLSLFPACLAQPRLAPPTPLHTIGTPTPAPTGGPTSAWSKSCSLVVQKGIWWSSSSGARSSSTTRFSTRSAADSV